MGKVLYIAEKPGVAQEFAKALKLDLRRANGYLESKEAVVTWCYGHLVTMSYPEKYDIKYKRWSIATLPFIPHEFKYEVIQGVKDQFAIVSGLLNREDVSAIYVCTDSGREGEYIYRLVEMMAGVKGKVRRRVWIDSQTEEEILRGIEEAKDLSQYDNLSAAAFLRAKEDYLMGINFSRLLTLQYGDTMASYLGKPSCVVAVGRVMTCVLGMVVRREREIRCFVKTPFYRVISKLDLKGCTLEAEWRSDEGSQYYNHPALYKENGFSSEKEAGRLREKILAIGPPCMEVVSVQRRKENKKPPLLFNLAELQNTCSKLFRISPDETLKIVQELYEKKLVTYPRTDARVLSGAVAKEIENNIRGLQKYEPCAKYCAKILSEDTYKKISSTRYVDDKQITDHYAIIPTGQGLNALYSLGDTAKGVYEVIARRFTGIFYPPAVYQKTALVFAADTDGGRESFFANLRTLIDPGFMVTWKKSYKPSDLDGQNKTDKVDSSDTGDETNDTQLIEAVSKLRKGKKLKILDCFIKEGETTPPKRYNSGSLILAMENAGQFIEDDELRAQIKGSGIGTSATRAEILKKLLNNNYLALNTKTQIVTPCLLGEMVYDVVDNSIKPLLNAELTASWEKGLTYVANGEISSEEYMDKMEDFIRRRVKNVLRLNNKAGMKKFYNEAAKYY